MVAEAEIAGAAAQLPAWAHIAMPVDPISSANAAVAQITGVIRQAAQAVGTSFNYLLATAKVESNFNPNAAAPTSSARGLFQFIEQTWLATLKEAGPRLGYGQYADAIVRTPSGRMEVSDPVMREKILNLRHDPAANAAMAGAFTRSNAEILTRRLGRAPSEGELYIAHFLGAGGAAKLIKASSSSQVSAAELFPAAANANRSIFYDRQGLARKADQVYATLTGRYAVARAGQAAPSRVALAAATAPRKIARVVPDTAGITHAFAASNPKPARNDTAPVFHALFHTGEALASKVKQLWGVQGETRTAQVTVPPAGVAFGRANGGTHELFQDGPTEARSLFGAKS
jgi:hypothetical protein